MLALKRVSTIAQKRLVKTPSFQIASYSSFQDKERAHEAAFFNKEDEKALRKVLKKLKGQADQNDAQGVKEHVKHDKSGLKALGLKLTPEQEDALLKWKHEH